MVNRLSIFYITKKSFNYIHSVAIRLYKLMMVMAVMMS